MTTNTPASPGKEPVAAEPWTCAGCGTASLKTERACECPTNVLCRDGFQCWKDSDDPCSQLRDAAKLALETLAPWKDDDFVWATMTQLTAAIAKTEPQSMTGITGAELRVAIQRGLLAELGDTYDCTRVWSAWSYGTMDENDFVPVLDRLEDLIDTIAMEITAADDRARAALAEQS